MEFTLKLLLILLLPVCLVNKVSAQVIADSIAKKIDGLFKQYDNPKSPGCAVAVVRNGSLGYAKCFGMANLEYSIPITSKTMFEMGSISKQFTAYCILLLANEGKLSLDDDIRKYLPWMADFGKKITIKNLLYHTSGIRDQDQLLNIAGTRDEDLITQEHLIKVLSNQKTLNFDPGEQYMYSNSGFTLLGEIVRSVTGKSLREFADSAIFKPMGMASTHFHDDYGEVIANRAYPYMHKNKISIVNSSAVGAKGLYTNLEDMSKWAMNFCDPNSTTRPIIEQMMQKGRLNNGKDLDAGAGIMLYDYRGLKLYVHNGLDGGYNSVVGFFPEIKTGFILFNNFQNYGMGNKIEQMERLFIEETEPVKVRSMSKILADSVLKDTASVKQFVGSYITDDGDHTSFKIKNKKFYYTLNGTSTFLLIQTARDSFLFPGFYPGIKFGFKVKKGKPVTVQQIWPGGASRTMKKYDPKAIPTEKQLLAYTGTYYSPELDCNYRIVIKDHHLVLTNSKYNDAPLIIYDGDQLLCSGDQMNSLTIIRDKQGKVNGFEVNYHFVQDLRFNKVE